MKVTTSTHPLVQLRAACGFSRDALARLCGVSAASVQHYELGRAPVPLDFVRKVEAATGARAESLVSNTSKPVTLGGGPYNRKAFENWQAASRATWETAHDAEADEMAFRVRTLIEAAGSSFLHVMRRLEHALSQTASEAGISMEIIEAAERKRASIDTVQMTVKQLSETVGDSPIWKSCLRSHPRKPTEKATVTIERFRHWVSDEELARMTTGAPTPEGVVYGVRGERVLYRIVFFDGKRVEVPVNEFRVRGVGGKCM